MKISVVLRECPQKLRDHLLVNSQQLESNYNNLRAIIQAYLNTNKKLIVNDLRETDPMGVVYIGKSKSKGKARARAKARAKEKARIATKAKAKARTTAKAKAVENLTMTKSATCAEKGVISHETVGHEQNHDKMVNEVEVENANAEPGKEYVYTIEHEVNVVNLSQSGCGVNKIEERKTARDWDPRTHECLVMINSGASVNVCPKWFGNSRMEQSDGVTCLRRANGKPLQEYGKRQIWFKIFGQTETIRFPCG